MANEDISVACIKAHVKKYEVANKLGISDSLFSKRLRTEFTKDEKEKVFRIIKDLERR